MSAPRDALRYVVDANVALDGTIPESLFAPTKDKVAYEAAFRFLAQAVEGGAELHVPHLFFSELALVITRDAVGGGLIGWEDARSLMRAVLAGAQWRSHQPDPVRVLEITEALGRTRNPGDSEYLAVAEALGCELVTGDGRLARAVAASGLAVSVVEAVAHPWALTRPPGADFLTP